MMIIIVLLIIRGGSIGPESLHQFASINQEDFVLFHRLKEYAKMLVK